MDSQVLPLRLPLEKLEADKYTVAESILVIPSGWPEGKIKVFLGIMDEVCGSYIRPEVSGLEQDENRLIYIGNIDVKNFNN